MRYSFQFAILSFVSAFTVRASAQEAPLKSSIDSTKMIKPENIWGYWRNSSHSFNKVQVINFRNKSKKSLGSINDDTIYIPTEDTSPDYIEIQRTGNFIDQRYPNAKWQLIGNYIYIKPQWEPAFRAFINRNDSTNSYSLSYGGNTFVSMMHQSKKEN
jgi:hypothetical protein